MLPAAAFRRDRWARVVDDPALVDELEAEHAALDVGAQIEASAHVDEVSDADLRVDLAGRAVEPPGETPKKARGRAEQPQEPAAAGGELQAPQ